MTTYIRDTPDGPLLNVNMMNYIEDIMKHKQYRSNIVDTIFDPEIISFANKSIKSGNFYIFDKYNLVIRKNDQNKPKSAFGWVYDEEGDPINIHIPKMLLDTNSDNITAVTLQTIKSKYPNIFKEPRGQLYRIYAMTDKVNINILNI